MIFAAICHLKAKEEPPKPAPSRRWFQLWLKAHPDLHTIKTKPISHDRIEIHDEKVVIDWFENFQAMLAKRRIKRGKNIHNFDESGVRVGCPRGETIVVPIDCKEKYTRSPENRKSLSMMESISADGREPPPPAIIVPGKRIMDSWIHDNLKGDELILLSDTGYTNDTLAVAWMKHFIKHVDAGLNKPWKMLLLNEHITHEDDEFSLLADANHIQLFYLPSHLTHIMQPLDVGVFQP